MILPDWRIQRLIADGCITGADDPRLVQPASLELRLAPQIRVPRTRVVDGRPCPLPVDPLTDAGDRYFDARTLGGEVFYLEPGGFILAASVETFAFPAAIAGELMGKSSLARWGLVVHCTAGLFDPGFTGKAVFEIGNMGKFAVRLTAGMRIAQMVFVTMESRVAVPYGSAALGSHYQGQGDAQTALAQVY